MKKHIIVKREALENMLNCFVDQEEFQNFSRDLCGMIEEIITSHAAASGNRDDEELVTALALKQLLVVGIFFRNNIELLHELVKAIEYHEVSPDELEDLKKKSPLSFYESAQE